MANTVTSEISVSTSISGVSRTIVLGPTEVTMTGDRVTELIQEVGTDWEGMDFGDVATPALLLVENLDSTNIVEVSHLEGSEREFAELQPREWLFMRLHHDMTVSKLRFKALVAACMIRTMLAEK